MIITDEIFKKEMLTKQNHLNKKKFCSDDFREYKDWFFSRFPDLPNESDTKEILYRLINGFEERPKCKNCGKEIDFNKGFKYRDFCCKSCQGKFNSEKRNETNLRKYGVKSCAALPEVREKIKKTNLERYGAEHNWGSKELREKIKKTNLEKYGYEEPLACPEIREKRRQTLQENYNVDVPAKSEEIRERMKSTTKKRFGVESIFSKDSPLRKIIQEKHNEKRIQTLEKIKKTNLEKYGSVSSFGNSEVREKAKATLLKKYGVTNAWQMKEVRDKIDYSKVRETTIANGNARSSRVEDLLYSILLKHFDYSDIMREYNRDPRYPWHCDFYIESIDFFIELQGFYTHGTHPFDPTDENDLIAAELIKEKGWDNILSIWCDSDVRKRNYAVEKGLNYLEIFDIDVESIEDEILSIINNEKGYQVIL